MSALDTLADLLSELRYRVRALFHRDDLERELDDELRFHLERETARFESRGMSHEQAARRARLEFGGIDRTKEEARDARGVRAIETILRDVRYAVRGLRAHPGFALAVIMTLALGIGANAAMFGIVDRLLFRPLPFLRDPASVHRAYLSYSYRGERITDASVEYRRYLDLAASTTLAQRAAYSSADLAIGTDQDTREMHVNVVSASFFGFFSVRPVIGRFFSDSEDSVHAGTPVVVLGNALWKARFGSRSDILGQHLQVGALNATIIGVAPEGFAGSDLTQPADAFIPITAYAESELPGYDTGYTWGFLTMIVRAKQGVALETGVYRSHETVRAQLGEGARAQSRANSAHSCETESTRGSSSSVLGAGH